MAKIINITDRFDNEKPKIKIGEKEFEVNDSVETVLKFEELANDGSIESLNEAIKITLGEDAIKYLNMNELSISNFKVLTIAVLAAIQGLEYEEAEARFRTFQQ